MTFSAFETVSVPFPFSDRPVTKRRPALVVSSAGFNTTHAALMLAMITSARQSTWASDVPITDLDGAGLSVECVVRMKLFTLATSLIDRRLGKLTAADQATLKARLAESLAIA